MNVANNSIASVADVRDAMRRLLHPRSIAIVGASSDAAKFSGRPISYLRTLGYAGQVYPINPGASEIQGYRCYPDITDVPDLVDAVIIARPAAEVPAEIQKCLDAGVRAFVVFSSGFAEAGPAGELLQARMTRLCSSYGAVLCGPNCTGLFNAPERAALSFMSNLDVDFVEGGTVSLISNSGSIAAMIYQERARLFNLVASTGNEAVLTSADFIDAALDEPDTRGVVAYIESLGGGEKLLAAAARAKKLGKTIAVLKVGRTAQAAEIAASHTGALVNDDAVVDAVFRRHSILRVESIEELKAVAQLIHACAGRVVGNRLGVVTTSGGTAVLITDLLDGRGMELPALDRGTADRLHEIVPGINPHNTLDVTGFGADGASFGKAAEALVDDPSIDVLLAPMGGAIGKLALSRAQALVALWNRTNKLIVPVWQSTTRDQAGYQLLLDQGLPVMTDYEIACKALALFATHRKRLAAEATSASLSAPCRSTAVQLPQWSRGRRALSEPEVKSILASACVDVPASVYAASSHEIAATAGKASYPAVLKIVSREILHKNAIGGVKIVRNADEVGEAAQVMLDTVKQNAPGTRLEGFLLEEMALGGTELLVGVKRDVYFGLTITLAMGGVLANAFDTARTELLPLDEASATELVRGFSSYFSGTAMEAALVDLLLRVASVAEAFGDRLQTLEINPVKLIVEVDDVRAVALDGVVEFLEQVEEN